MMKSVSIVSFFFCFLIFGATALIVEANHAWGNYHWGRMQNPFTLQLGDNVTTKWDAHLAQSVSDWSSSAVMNLLLTSGQGGKNCRATTGRVEVCNARYGANGWLGIAQIWVSGEHITKGVVKMNDTYFDTATYNTPAWRNLVMCQEIGHTLGLGHTDENFNNVPEGTCMDYSNDPVPNQHPNQHDFDMLETIYTHLDASNTYASGVSSGGNKGKPSNLGRNIDLNNPSAWGKAVREDAQGNKSLYVQDLGDERVFTFVTWTSGEHDHE